MNKFQTKNQMVLCLVVAYLICFFQPIRVLSSNNGSLNTNAVACSGLANAGVLTAMSSTTICVGEPSPIFFADYSDPTEIEPVGNYKYYWFLTQAGTTPNDIIDFKEVNIGGVTNADFGDVGLGDFCVHGMSMEWTDPNFSLYNYTSLDQILNEIAAGTICADLDLNACIPLNVVECEISIAEPCTCRDNPTTPGRNGNETTNENGQFNEKIKVEAPTGQIWHINSAYGLFKPSSHQPPALPLPFWTGNLGVKMEEVPLGNGMSDYTLEGIHVDAIGYQITVENNLGVKRTIPRTKCYYPDLIMEGWTYTKKYCEGSGIVQITGSDRNGGTGFGGFRLFKGNTLVQTSFGSVFSFDATQLALGDYELEFTFDAEEPGADNARNPGCSQTISENFSMVSTPTAMACNSGVWVSLGPNCEADMHPDFVLEGSYGCYDDYQVTVYHNGTVIPTSPVVTVANVGQTLTVKVMHVPTGNKCWGSIGIADRIKPEIDCGGPFILDCTEDPATVPIPTATDGCDSNPQILFTGESTQLNPCGTTIISKTYRARDYRGNLSATCTQEIHIIQAPVTFPEDVTWTCEQYAAFPDIIRAEKMHRCLTQSPVDVDDDQGGIEPFDSWTDGEDYDIGLLPDFDDVLDNPLTDPIPNTIQFSTIATPSSETDSYDGNSKKLVCNLSINYTEPFNYLIDNSRHIPDTFKIPNYPTTASNGLPIRGLEDADILALTGSGVPNVLDTDCPFTVTSADRKLEACPGQGTSSTFKILRTWTLVNHCTGVVTTDVQTIKVLDKKAPVIRFQDDFEYEIVADQYQGGNLSECASSGRLDVPHFYDNCSGIEDIKVFTPVGLAEPVYASSGGLIGFRVPAPYLTQGVHEVTYQVTDGCGNMTSEVVNITVIDGIPPVPICRELTQISLTTNDLYTEVDAKSFDEGSYDNCGSVYFKIRRVDTNCSGQVKDRTRFDDFINFCCEDVGDTTKVLIRVYDVEPRAGEVGLAYRQANANDCEVEVLVSDFMRPDCVPPADVWTTCEDVPDNLDLTDTLVLQNAFGDAIGQDNCQGFAEELTPVIDLDFCGVGTVTRTFRAFDNHGNRSSQSCRQTIMIQPVIMHEIHFPSDYQIDCMMPMADTMTYEEIGCDLLAKNIEDRDFIGTPDGACKKILRTYRVINWCSYDGWSDPVQLPRLDLNNNGEFGDGYTAISDGDNIYRNSISTNNFMAAAMGFVEYTQHIKVFDGEAPVLSEPDNLEFCGGEKDEDPCTGYVSLLPKILELCTPDYVTVRWDLDLFADGSINESGSDSLTGRYVLGVHRAKFDVFDDCGNRSEIVIDFEIIDCKAPTPVCHQGLAADLMSDGSVPIWASDFNASSFDYCHPIKFKINKITDRTGDGFITSDDFITTPPTSDSVQFTCADAGSVKMIQFWVGEESADNVNNWDFCTTFIEIQDNFHNCPGSRIALDGNIKMENDRNVGNVMIEISGGQSMTMMTSTDGNYNFDNVQMGSDFTITPHRNDDHTAGVSTIDLIYIQKHLLNVEKLDSPYKIIAADANKSNSISTLDLIELKKLILRTQTELAKNTSWRFIPKDFIFPNRANPWETYFPELMSYNNVTTNMSAADFVAIKIGDVTLDVDPNNANKIDGRTSDENYVFDMKDQNFSEGDRVEVSFKTNDSTPVEGFQFTINFNEENLEFEKVNSGVLDENNFGFNFSNEGKLTVSWNGQSGINLAEKDLFSLVFSAKEKGDLSENLSIGSDLTNAEAYAEDAEVLGVNIQFEKEKPTDFFVAQNRPNPFSDFTIIDFGIAEKSNVEFTIFMPNGTVIRHENFLLNAGEHQFKIDKNDLPEMAAASGIYFYRIQTDEFSEVRKMILIK